MPGGVPGVGRGVVVSRRISKVASRSLTGAVRSMGLRHEEEFVPLSMDGYLGFGRVE